jgi:hypothetical protein
MKRYKFTCPDDVRDFIEEMINADLVFHLDDDPEDIFPVDDDISKAEIYCLKLNMIDLWKYCDPWQVLDYYPETESRYMGRDYV